MRYDIVPFDASHFAALGISSPLLERFGRLYIRDGLGFVGRVDGQPLCALGICRMWSGVGEAWGFFLPDASRYPVFLHRSVRRYLPRLMETMNLHRVQCTVSELDHRACQWIVRLGFQYEGRLRAFSPAGEAYLLYSLIREP